jgi:hypothetical protein
MIRNFIEDLATVYFSKDRPMQLDLALNTNQTHSVDWQKQEEFVLYKASNIRYEKAYQRVQKEHSSVFFIPEKNFKNQLLDTLKDYKYVMFVTDDTIFVRDYYLSDILPLMNNFSSAIGFSLRLGENTTYCYPLDTQNKMPEFLKIKDLPMYVFNWREAGRGDFSYPLEVSSSIYRIVNIYEVLAKSDYSNPNSLEWQMALTNHRRSNMPYLLCYDNSVAFSNPVNMVQTENNVNRRGNKKKYQPEQLLEKYEKRLRIKSNDFYGFVPSGCHQEVDYEFTTLLDLD